MLFKDRAKAGALLAKPLEAYRGASDTLVVALPRGGVAVAEPIAKALDLPLEIFFVKKIPSPYNEEFGIGAVSENGLVSIDSNTARALGVDKEYIERTVSRKLHEMHDKRRYYGRAIPDFYAKRVILVDDGIATGSSILLAARAIKQAGASELIIAVPVAPIETIPILESVADRVVVLHASDNLIAVGRFYEDFHQLDDKEVLEALNSSKGL